MLLLTSFFTLFNALLLFSGSGKYTKGNYYLALVFFLLGFFGLNSPTALNSINPKIGIFIFPSSLPLNLLIGPFLFFYFRFVIKKINFKFSSDYKHLLIFFIAMINMVPFHLYSFQAKIKIYEKFLIDMMSPFSIKLLFTSLSDMYLIINMVTIFYLILCFFYLMENKEKLASGLKSESFKIIDDWLKWLYINFLILFFSNIIIGVRAFYLGYLPEPYYFHLVSTVLLLLNIKLYQYPTILYGIKIGSDENQKKISLVHLNQKRLKFDENFHEHYQSVMNELIDSREILDEDYSLQLMAKQLNVSSYILNKFLKVEFKINFSQLVSKTRIKILIDSVEPADLKKYSLIGLVKLYGFKSIKQFKIDLEKYTSEDYASFISKMKKDG